MRLKVTLHIERATFIPLNYQYALSSAVYRFLETADSDYAQFLHFEGYAPLSPAEGTDSRDATLDRRRFKLFTFSQLKAERSRVDIRMRGEEKLHLLPGRVEWQIASPVEPFLTNFASGLLTSGVLRITSAELPIAHVETLSPPQWQETLRCKCLSPIVAAVGEKADGKYHTRYLRPKDPAWSERVRENLLGKYSALHGTTPEDTRLSLRFDTEYLEKHRGTKLVTYKEIQIVGAFAPFTLSTSKELFEVAYNCGVGEKNAAGFGMVEVVEK